jgi:KUP system potassium uptake protein
MVLIATLATVVASQALISGAYSLTQQAVQLGFMPRMAIVHTSASTEGQIFVPTVNAALMFACIAVVMVAGSSSRLAAAYGIAVTGTMSITSILFYAVARRRWHWSRLRAGTLVSLFLVVDLAFFGGELRQDLPRRLVSDGGRTRRLQHDDHLEDGSALAPSGRSRRCACRSMSSTPA